MVVAVKGQQYNLIYVQHRYFAMPIHTAAVYATITLPVCMSHSSQEYIKDISCKL